MSNGGQETQSLSEPCVKWSGMSCTPANTYTPPCADMLCSRVYDEVQWTITIGFFLVARGYSK